MVRGERLGRLDLLNSAGKKDGWELNSKIFFNSWCSSFGNWRIWMPWTGLHRYGLKPVLALEWRETAGRRFEPEKFVLVPSRGGVEAGLTVLGAVQYDE